MEIQLASAAHTYEPVAPERTLAVQAVQLVTEAQAAQSAVKEPAPEQATHFWVVESRYHPDLQTEQPMRPETAAVAQVLQPEVVVAS